MIAAAVRALPQPPSELLAVRLEGVELRVYPDQVAALVDEAQAESANHAAGRDRLRMKLVRAFYERYTQRLGVAAYHSFDDIEAALRTGGYLNRTLDALWPRPKPDQLVRRLLTQPGGSSPPRPRGSSTRTSSGCSSRAAGRAGRTPTCRSSTRRGRSSRGPTGRTAT